MRMHDDGHGPAERMLEADRTVPDTRVRFGGAGAA